MVDDPQDYRSRYASLPLLLAEIRKRPAMFLGRKTIYGLHIWLGAVSFAEEIHRIPNESRIGEFDRDSFEKWIEGKYNSRKLSVNSFWLAEQIAGSETDGFDLWFEWYDAFQALPPRENREVLPE